jgi:hypothetical protein
LRDKHWMVFGSLLRSSIAPSRHARIRYMVPGPQLPHAQSRAWRENDPPRYQQFTGLSSLNPFSRILGGRGRELSGGTKLPISAHLLSSRSTLRTIRCSRRPGCRWTTNSSHNAICQMSPRLSSWTALVRRNPSDRQKSRALKSRCRASQLRAGLPY